jgi:hypothetical protein
MPLIYRDHLGGKPLKSKYEKPIAMPLGEAARGSGQCNAGSGVGPLVGSSICNLGTLVHACFDGSGASPCEIGQSPAVPAPT